MSGFGQIGRGGGFALGPVNNLFGTTAGDATASPSTVTPATSKAAAETVRDVYFAANPDNLAAYDADSAFNIRIFYTDSGNTIIVHQIRQGSAWVDNASTTGVEGMPGSGTDFSGISDFHLPMIGAGPDKMPLDSGIARLESGEGMYEFMMGASFPRNSVEIGQANRVSGFGALLKILSLVTSDTFVLPFQRYTVAGGSQRTQELAFAAPAMRDVQPIFTETIPLTGQFTLSGASQPSRVIWEISFRCPPSGVLGNLRFQMTVSGMTTPFFAFPSGAAYEAGQGEDITSDATGIHMIDLTDAPILLGPNQDVVVDYAMDSGVPLGDTNNVPWLRVNESEVSDVDLARLSEIPTTVIELTDVTDAGSGAIITAVERSKLAGIAENAEVNVQSDWNESDTGSDAFIQNKPTIPTPRTDEEIRDVMGATLVAGMNIMITPNDAADTITISATGGGGGTPTPSPADDIWYGLSDENNPAHRRFNHPHTRTKPYQSATL